MGLFSKAKKFVKKLISAPVKIVKAVVDPAIDFVTNTVKAVISPFSGGFDLPDTSINFDETSNAIKAAVSVDFNSANRAIPVLYGTRVETGTIPVFVDTWGDDSADTSRQYLYMAAVISQGSHFSNNDKDVDGWMGSLMSRMTIDGKPVHLGGLTNTMNDNYSNGYDGSTTLNKTDSGGGIFASGKGGVQPTQHTITKGTFANRLKIQYFDGSADQPVSSLLDEHPEWSKTGQAKLSGIHYVALRFEIKAADEVVGGSDGNGTFGNPYSGVPAVVVTVSGKSTPNIIAAKDNDPGYEERFQTNYAEPRVVQYMTYAKTLNNPDSSGDLKADLQPDFGQPDDEIGEPAAKHTVFLDSDTVIEWQRFRDFQPGKYASTGATQTINIHDILYNLGWTYDYVYFWAGDITGNPLIYNSDSTSLQYFPPDGDASQWLKHVGGGHYRFLGKVPRSNTYQPQYGEVTFFGYNDDYNTYGGSVNYISGNRTSLWDAIESDWANVTTTGRSELEDSNITFYAEDNDLINIFISDKLTSPRPEHLIRIRERRPEVYNIPTANRLPGEINNVYEAVSSDAYSNFTVFGCKNLDSSAIVDKDGDMTELQRMTPPGAEIYMEVYFNGVSAIENQDKHPANYQLLEQLGYQTDGLFSQSYRPDNNPVEHILDYMLNPNYGMGLSLDKIDKTSFVNAAITCQRVPEFKDFDRTLFYFGGNDATTAERNEYMYGEAATTGASANGSVLRTANNSYDRVFRINTNNSHLNNINQMLSSIGGILTVINGRFTIRLENAGDNEDSENIPPVTALTISATIEDRHILDTVSLSDASINDRYNQIKLDYTEITNSSQPASVMTPDPIEDSTGIRDAYLAEDNDKPLEADFAVPSIFDPESAKKYSTFLLKKSRNQARLEMRVSHVALDCVPGSFVRVRSNIMKIDDVYRITTVTYNNDNTVSLSLIRHIPDFYDVSDTGLVLEAKRNIMDLK
jgi:hypothetical protein